MPVLNANNFSPFWRLNLHKIFDLTSLQLFPYTENKWCRTYVVNERQVLEWHRNKLPGESEWVWEILSRKIISTGQKKQGQHFVSSKGELRTFELSSLGVAQKHEPPVDEHLRCLHWPKRNRMVPPDLRFSSFCTTDLFVVSPEQEALVEMKIEPKLQTEQQETQREQQSVLLTIRCLHQKRSSLGARFHLYSSSLLRSIVRSCSQNEFHWTSVVLMKIWLSVSPGFACWSLQIENKFWMAFRIVLVQQRDTWTDNSTMWQKQSIKT